MRPERALSARSAVSFEGGNRLISIGVDAHKRVHAADAVDEAGRELGAWRGSNSLSGWEKLLDWAKGLGAEVVFGVEGACNYGRGLSQYLVASGYGVYDVNPRLTALGRRRARRPDKSDRLDARAIALAVMREADKLPAVTLEDETSLLNMLSSERDDLRGEETRIRNQIHQLLFQIDTTYQNRLPSLTSKAGMSRVLRHTYRGADRFHHERASAVRRYAQRLKVAADQTAELTRRIEEIAVARFRPLMEITGIGALNAGVLAGMLGPRSRFAREEQLAVYAGAAPLETSSAGAVRHRLNRGGNRRLNAVLHRIVLSQIRHSGPARAYVDRRVSEGKTRRESIRAAKRYVARAIWHVWQQCGPGEPASKPERPQRLIPAVACDR